MAKYRKKPVVIEAVEWRGQNHHEIFEFCGLDNFYFSDDQKELFIPTLEGVHKANVGDYIIKGVNGEFYPCKPDIFEKTYEIVKEQEGGESMNKQQKWVENHPITWKLIKSLESLAIFFLKFQICMIIYNLLRWWYYAG